MRSSEDYMSRSLENRMKKMSGPNTKHILTAFGAFLSLMVGSERFSHAKTASNRQSPFPPTKLVILSLVPGTHFGRILIPSLDKIFWILIRIQATLFFRIQRPLLFLVRHSTQNRRRVAIRRFLPYSS